jgi:glycosyltransferase involved in cell wall biosynthesis
VVAVGQCVRQALIDYEGLKPARVEVIYNGVDLGRYDPQRSERERVRAEWGVKPDETVIVQVARLNHLKDHGTALRALARLAAERPRVRLVVVGDGEERAEIERLIQQLRMEPFVCLLGTRTDVPRLLQGADVMLLSSITEGIPLTLIEAMATGLPCVATRVGGVPEVVVDGHTGLLAQAAAPDGLASCLQTLCDDADLRQRMGAAGRRRAEEKFDDRQMHAAYQRMYAEMLGENQVSGVRCHVTGDRGGVLD